MKKAIITGASSGIGKEIAKTLLTLKYKVLGVGRNFDKCGINNKNFTPIICDFKDKKALHRFLEEHKKEDISILVNCAGFGKFAPHEELSMQDIEDMVQVNLTAPLLLSKTFLRAIKKNRGYIFNICSISGIKQAPFGVTYGATKAALRHFSSSLFAEDRKSGMKVISINPDITNTSFFDKLHFKPNTDPLSFIEPSCIANIIKDILDKKEGTVITDITVEPQLFKIDKKRV